MGEKDNLPNFLQGYMEEEDEPVASGILKWTRDARCGRLTKNHRSHGVISLPLGYNSSTSGNHLLQYLVQNLNIPFNQPMLSVNETFSSDSQLELTSLRLCSMGLDP